MKHCRAYDFIGKELDQKYLFKVLRPADKKEFFIECTPKQILTMHENKLITKFNFIDVTKL